MPSLEEQIKLSKSIFDEKMFNCETESGDTLMCSINEAFEDFHSNGHNCLGCSLQEEADFISSFLASADSLYSPKDFFKVYLMLLYLLTEKLLEITKIIGLPPSYKEEEFEVFRTIKLWANFHKHPKAFILTHHPDYWFEGEKGLKQYRGNKKYKTIDLAFLKRYYRGEDPNKYRSLVKELKNNSKVIVVLPQIDKLTRKFCEACSTLIEIVKENKAYKEILNDLTTLEDYFAE